MENDNIFKNNELIPLLIKYVKVNKVIFPIKRVKHLSNEEVVDILKDCIKNKIIFNPRYDMVDKITLLSDNELKNILVLIKESMDYINYNYMNDINKITGSDYKPFNVFIFIKSKYEFIVFSSIQIPLCLKHFNIF